MVAITVDLNIEGFLTWVNVTGLTPGTRYDVLRMQVRYTGEDDTANPTYHRELPDRRKHFSAVAHRMGWEPAATSRRFRDYEPLRRPFQYFIVESDLGSPLEYGFGDLPRYPLTLGTLSPVVHFNREARGLHTAHEGQIVMRSTWELGLWTDICVYDLNVGYKSRGSELTVMKREDPLFIADTRESRRGSITLMTERLGQYHDLRRMLFPANGRIRPVTIHSGGDSTLLLDDMDIIPLDVEVEQATQSDPDLRFIHVDFIETDAVSVKLHRSGDNDNLVSEPVADFTISDDHPAVGEWITLTDASSGLMDEFDWSITGKLTDNKIGKWSGEGPHRVRFLARGPKIVKLRVYGSGAGADVTSKVVHVGA